MNCKWIEGVLAVIVIIFALWQTSASQVILVIAGALFLIHALSCQKCGGACESPQMSSARPAKKRKSCGRRR